MVVAFFRLLFMAAICVFCVPRTLKADLDGLVERIQWELETINYPGETWLPPLPQNAPQDVLDVAIVGGGMAGMTAAFALQKQGIQNLQIFDESPQGCEGPWVTTARMRTLRSDKYDTGPSFWVPSLTFRAWYEVRFGSESWKNLSMAPTRTWMDYLCWYRKVLNLPMVNSSKLVSIEPSETLLRLIFREGDRERRVWARKVVLATGRTGFGGLEIPEWVQGLPKACYAHSAEQIDFAALAGKRVVVVGAGASGFDSAAVALEHGASSVHMVVRRPIVNPVNKFGGVAVPGFILGYYSLSDQERWDFMAYAFDNGIPPPKESLFRVQKYANFFIHANCAICSVKPTLSGVEIATSQGDLSADYMILACGFDFDGGQRPELKGFLDKILLWQHRVDPDTCESCPKLAHAPYLGPHFQFREKNEGHAPFLKHIYCFNYGATISHGLLTGDIEGMSASAARLAEGIAADFFLENSAYFYRQMLEYNDPVFSPEDLAPLRFCPLP